MPEERTKVYIILDNNGIIHQGSWKSMNIAYAEMVKGDETSEWYTEWEGDLYLAEVLAVWR